MVDGGQVGIKAVPDFSGFGSLFSQGVRGAITQAQGLGKELSTALGGGMKAGLALAGAGAALAITDFVAHGVRAYTDLANTTRELDAITGASAERTSLFAGVLRNLGIDAGSAGRPLGILANNIQNHTQLFDKYGVAIAHTKDGQADLLGTLDNLRKSFVGSADATQRDAAAKNLLGRGFQTLIPYLELSNTQLKQFEDIARRSGAVFTEEDINKARQMAVNLEMANEHIKAVEISAGRIATGALNDVFKGFNVWSKTGIGDLFRVIGSPLTGGIIQLPDHIKNAVTAEENLSRAAAQTKIDLANEAAAVDTLGTAIEGLHSAEEGVQHAEQGVQHAAEGVTKAQEGVQKSHEATARASQSYAAAQQSLNDLLAKGAVDAKAVTAAQQGVESADKAVQTATESLAGAQRNLNELQQFAAQDSAAELTNAHLSLADATLSLADARRALYTARPTLQDPNAQQKARLAVQHAVLAQQQAQENLTKAQQFGTSADNQLTAAQKAVRDATANLTSSLDAQIDAQKKLAEAQAGDPQFQEKVAAAKQAVANAGLAVRDAQTAERDAGQSLRDAQQSFSNSEQTLTDAKIKVRDATDKVNSSLDTEAALGVNVKIVLDELKQKYPELAGVIEQFYSRVSAARVAATPPAAPLTSPRVAPGTDIRSPIGPGPNRAQSPPSSYDIHRASGGRVFPGQNYIVNEQRGEGERVTFDAPGMVRPANLTPVGGDGGSITAADIGAAVAAALIASGRPLVTVGEQVVLAQKRYGTATRGRQ